MSYILRDDKVSLIREHRFKIAELLLNHEQVETEEVMDAMQRFINIDDFIYDEIMFAIDLIQETHFDFLVRVCDLAEQGDIAKDGDDYVLDHDIIDEMRESLEGVEDKEDFDRRC